MVSRRSVQYHPGAVNPMLRLTFDWRGLRRVERLGKPSSRHGIGSDYIAFVVEEIQRFAGATVDFQVGLDESSLKLARIETCTDCSSLVWPVCAHLSAVHTSFAFRIRHVHLPSAALAIRSISLHHANSVQYSSMAARVLLSSCGRAHCTPYMLTHATARAPRAPSKHCQRHCVQTSPGFMFQ